MARRTGRFPQLVAAGPGGPRKDMKIVPAKPTEESETRDTAARLAGSRPKSLAKAHLRFETKAPPATPPELICPSCDRPLLYECSHVGGVNTRHSEQWDDYTCSASCGTFVYRHRTRKLRRVG